MQSHGQQPALDTSVAQFYSTLAQLPPEAPEQQQQQQQQLQPDLLSGSSQPDAVQPQQQHVPAQRLQRAHQVPQQLPAVVPFAPVKFSTRTHLLDPNTGAITLPPKASGADTSPTHQQRHHQQQQHQQQHQHHQQHQQQPMHPDAAANTASTKRPIDRKNLGYQLLSKAGWQEGQGLGAKEQGRAAPLAVSYHKGSSGLGFSKQQQPLQQPSQAQHPAGSVTADSTGPATAAAAAVAGPVLGGKRVAAIVAAELASEDLDTKVKRHRQLREQKAKEERDKAIQSYMYRAFNDVEAPDSNPLLAGRSHRLTATNPLLD